MIKYLKRNDVRTTLFLLFYLISMSIPFAFKEILVIRGAFIFIRIVGTGILLFCCMDKRVKWNSFDIITLLFCTTIFISAFHAGFSQNIATNSTAAYLYSAFSKLVFIFGQLLMIKYAFNTQEKCFPMIKTIYWYYLMLCVINLLTQIMGFQVASDVSKSEYIFFWGRDNDIGKYYIIAFFYSSVIMVLKKKEI